MEKQDRIWTIPNGISLLRLLVIVPIILYLHSGKPWIALILMLAGGATDLLDGWLARRLNQRTGCPSNPAGSSCRPALAAALSRAALRDPREARRWTWLS